MKNEARVGRLTGPRWPSTLAVHVGRLFAVHVDGAIRPHAGHFHLSPRSRQGRVSAELSTILESLYTKLDTKGFKCYEGLQ